MWAESAVSLEFAILISYFVVAVSGLYEVEFV